MDRIETPRLVKKPDGSRKRVENQDELAAALADGWKVRLDDPDVAPVAPEPEMPMAEPALEPTPEPVASEPEDLASALTADLERQEHEQDESEDGDETEPSTRRPGRHAGAKKK